MKRPAKGSLSLARETVRHLVEVPSEALRRVNGGSGINHSTTGTQTVTSHTITVVDDPMDN